MFDKVDEVGSLIALHYLVFTHGGIEENLTYWMLIKEQDFYFIKKLFCGLVPSFLVFLHVASPVCV